MALGSEHTVTLNTLTKLVTLYFQGKLDQAENTPAVATKMQENSWAKGPVLYTPALQTTLCLLPSKIVAHKHVIHKHITQNHIKSRSTSRIMRNVLKRN